MVFVYISKKKQRKIAMQNKIQQISEVPTYKVYTQLLLLLACIYKKEEKKNKTKYVNNHNFIIMIQRELPNELSFI